MRELADQVGLSPASLYQRFGGKDALFLRALAPSPPDRSTWPDAMRAEDGLTYWMSLAEHLAGWFDEVLPAVLRLLAHPGIRESLGPQHADLHRALLAPVSQRLEQLAERGLLAGDPQQAAQLLLTLAHDASISSVMLAGQTRDRDRLDQLVRLAWHGLAPG